MLVITALTSDRTDIIWFETKFFFSQCMKMSQEKFILCTQCVFPNERNELAIWCRFCWDSYSSTNDIPRRHYGASTSLQLSSLKYGCGHSMSSIPYIEERLPSLPGLWQEKAECRLCHTLEELKHKEQEVKELQDKYEKSSKELQKWQKKFEDFKERMVVDVSAEMGSSGALSEDINNPCRETKLRKMFDKLRLQTLAKYLTEIKNRSKTDKNIDVTKEKLKLNAMLQNVFTKAEHDMTKKKEDFLSFFKVSKNKEEVKNKKQLQYIDLAVQNLQMIIFHGKPKYYQTMHKELGNSDPDRLCELADDCYWLGCLMALHNPPLILDWKNKKQSDILPPIKNEETPL